MGIVSPEKTPEWIEELIQSISSDLKPSGLIGQLGFRYLPPDAPMNSTQRWLIGVYLVPYELSGGRYDGAEAVAGFSMNIKGLLSLFSDVLTLEWKVPRGYTDGLSGPEVWLEGTYRQSKKVQLHIYADPPLDEVPDLVLDVTTNELRVK